MSWRIEGAVELVNCSHKFAVFAKENAGALARHFGGPVFPGSLNVRTATRRIGEALDSGRPPPDVVIPKADLRGMPGYLGDGRAWRCRLRTDHNGPVRCFLFRREGSRVRPGVVEVLAAERLVDLLGLTQGQAVALEGE